MKRVLVLVIAACSRRDPIASCDDDLRGVYADGDERWMILDHGDELEAYPLFPDGTAPDRSGPTSVDGAVGVGSATPEPASRRRSADVIVAPRVIDFQRAPAAPVPGSVASAPEPEAARPGPAGAATVAGTLRRRYMRRAERCEAQVPVHITRCAGDTLELVLSDPSPPISFSPCTWSHRGPSRVVRWRRE